MSSCSLSTRIFKFLKHGLIFFTLLSLIDGDCDGDNDDADKDDGGVDGELILFLFFEPSM